MTLLSRNTTPAERARGCAFSELFRDPDAVARNGGVATGAPVIDKGVTLDGSTQYLTYNAVGSFFASDEISIVIEFWPDFMLGDGQDRYLLDASSGSRYFVYFTSTGVMSIRLGNVSVSSPPKADYEAYWNLYHKNVIVVIGTSGAIDVWFNGHLIRSTSVSWGQAYPVDMYLGSNYVGSSNFDGKITKFQIYKRLLTATEAADFYNGGIYSYRNETSLNLPMRAAEHDPVNTRSLDVSGNARHATLVGAPVKLPDAGYDLNGSTQYMTVTGTGVFNAAGVTIAVEFTPDFAAGDNVSYSLLDCTFGYRYLISKSNNNNFYVYCGDTNIGTIAYATYAQYWFKGRKNMIVVSGVSGATNVWLNGNLIATSATSWVAKNPTQVVIGVNYAYGGNFDGKIHSFRVWREALTPLQVADLS